MTCTQESHDDAMADDARWGREFHGHALWPPYRGEAAHCRFCGSTRVRAVPWVPTPVEAEDDELDAAEAA